MVALATYTKIDPDHLAAFSPTVIGLLRDQLGFEGVVLSDDLGETKAVADIAPADRAIDFLQAGGDMIISKTLDPAVEMARALVSKAASDPSFRALVDDAALRVLRAKDSVSTTTPASLRKRVERELTAAERRGAAGQKVISRELQRRREQLARIARRATPST